MPTKSQGPIYLPPQQPLTLEQARSEAHAIGLAMQPKTWGTFAHDNTDVAHLIEAVLGTTHPLKSMPSQRLDRLNGGSSDDWAAYEIWYAECQAIEAQISAAYFIGVSGGELPPPSAKD